MLDYSIPQCAGEDLHAGYLTNVLNDQPLRHLPQKTLGVLHTKRSLGDQGHCQSSRKQISLSTHLAEYCFQCQQGPAILSHTFPITTYYTPLKTNHTIQEFHLTEAEGKELNQLKEMACLFILWRSDAKMMIL